LQEKIQQFQKQLFDWYEDHRRQLPWRETSDPYCIWVSEVMLQQTRVKTVVPYYAKFLRRFPGVRHLAGAEQQAVLKLWEGLGYYGRARNLHRAAGIVVDRYGGDLPNDIRLFRDLPGVGEYIASAVMSFAFGQPCAAVDGNMKRVLARLNRIPEPVNGSGSGKIFKAAAERLLAEDASAAFNQAMMDLGSVVCTPGSPDCGNCPLREFCEGFETGDAGRYPRRIKKPATPLFHIAAGVIQKGRKVLITRRKTEGLLGGLWEFPGGKVKSNETAETACVREIREEVNLEVRAVEHVTRVRHAYSHFKIIMDVYRCRYLEGRIRLNGPADFRWIRLSETDDYPFPGANRKFIPLLKERMKDSF